MTLERLIGESEERTNIRITLIKVSRQVWEERRKKKKKNRSWKMDRKKKKGKSLDAEKHHSRACPIL